MLFPRLLCAGILAAAAFAAWPVDSAADTIAVIGTGRMGSAIGPKLIAAGHSVIYGSRAPSSDKVRALLDQTPGKARATSQQSAVAAADIIVIAIPWFAVEDFIKKSRPFDGKLIMDMTNATTMRDDGLLDLAVETSAGQLIQSWAPKASVVKTFNTVSYHIIADISIAKGMVTVPLVGNDPAAKAKAAAIVQALGFETIDIGPIRNARALEFMSAIHMVPYLTDRWDEAFEYYFVKGTAPTDVDAVRLAR